MDKKTVSIGLIGLSIVAALLAAIDYLSQIPSLGLGANSWLLVAATLGVYAVYSKVS